jgi:hypothetical protein
VKERASHRMVSPLVRRAVAYELLATVLVFFVSWAWLGSAPQASGLTVALFAALTAYYVAFHRLWPQ